MLFTYAPPAGQRCESLLDRAQAFANCAWRSLLNHVLCSRVAHSPWPDREAAGLQAALLLFTAAKPLLDRGRLLVQEGLCHALWRRLVLVVIYVALYLNRQFLVPASLI